MAQDKHPAFPGGSKKRVTKAGDAIRDNKSTWDDLMVITDWRAAHRPVLNTFQAILRTRARGKNVVVAQRHKRMNTITGKLRRFPHMQLARMDDVAGCRIIFEDIGALEEFRAQLHAARFAHTLRNEKDKYDYIASPKVTGYRGIHDVYEYDVRSTSGEKYKGLLIEIQFRTLVQHAWATCVELVGFVTQAQPKFQQGDDRYERILAYASEMLARVYEDRTSCFPDMENADVVRQFVELDTELGFMNLLKGINQVEVDVTDRKNAILIFSTTGDLQVKTYRDATDALKELFELEKAMPGADIVLVRADTSEEVKIAFKSYFSDAREFIRFVETAAHKMVSHSVDPLFADFVRQRFLSDEPQLSSLEKLFV